MSIFISMPDPARQLTREINRKGKSTPQETILREGIVNGSEANRRNLGPTERGEIHIKRDDFIPNKIAIINVGGEYFDEEKAKNNLNTIAGSGNEGYSDQTGLAENMGQGAKISYLPHAPKGILYRSKNFDGVGHTFHLKLLDEEPFYGIQSKTCDYYEEDSEFQYCSDFNSELASTEKTGTSMVLMGANDEEDSWMTMCAKCTPSAANPSYAGFSIFKYISNRFFKDIGDDIFIHVYDEDKNCNGKRKVPMGHDLMQKTDSYGVIDLLGDSIPSGTKLHFCLKSEYKSANQHAGLKGNVYFCWKKEVYFDHRESAATRSQRLRNSGIWHKPTEWILVVELPDDWEGYPSENRLKLNNINEFDFYCAISDNLPEEISEWMHENKNSDLESDEIQKWLDNTFKEISNSFKSKSPGTSLGNGPILITESNSKRPHPETQKKNASRMANKKRSLEHLKSFVVPDVVAVEDSESPLFEFMFEDYTLLMNTLHPLYIHREKKMIDTYSHIDASIIKDVLARYHFKGCISRIFDVQTQYHDKSINERKQKWMPDILEATWNHDSESAVKRYLSRLKKNIA